MATTIDRDEVARLLREEHAQLVEVLRADEHDDEHLPGAINIPLKRLDRETTQQLERERPVIVYCFDYQRDMSLRAASRLDSLGFPRVYEYAAGKADWGSYGFSLEGQADSSTRVSSVANTHPPTCRLDESVAAVAARLHEGWDISVVINERQVVLGLLGRGALGSATHASVESAMRPGPSTIRPSARIDAIRKRMREQNLTRIVVTRSDGRLFGVVRHEDLGADK